MRIGYQLRLRVSPGLRAPYSKAVTSFGRLHKRLCSEIARSEGQIVRNQPRITSQGCTALLVVPQSTKSEHKGEPQQFTQFGHHGYCASDAGRPEHSEQPRLPLRSNPVADDTSSSLLPSGATPLYTVSLCSLPGHSEPALHKALCELLQVSVERGHAHFQPPVL